MNVLRHLRGNFILSGVGVGAAIFSKHFFKKEILSVSSLEQILDSYFFLVGTTVTGKLIMDRIYEKYWIPYSAGGKEKVVNEGFIRPLQGDLLFLISPNRWDNRGNPDRWVPNQN